MADEPIPGAPEEPTPEPTPAGLTEKQEAYCQLRSEGRSLVEAYRRAGYVPSDSSSHDRKYAQRLERRPRVAARIAELRGVLDEHLEREKAHTSAGWWVDQIKQQMARASQSVPVYQRGRDHQQCVCGAELPWGEWKFDGSTFAKLAELLGKHLGLFEKKQAPETADLMGQTREETIAKLEEIAAQLGYRLVPFEQAETQTVQ